VVDGDDVRTEGAATTTPEGGEAEKTTGAEGSMGDGA
jgi:hypothetical protein